MKINLIDAVGEYDGMLFKYDDTIYELHSDYVMNKETGEIYEGYMAIRRVYRGDKVSKYWLSAELETLFNAIAPEKMVPVEVTDNEVVVDNGIVTLGTPYSKKIHEMCFPNGSYSLFKGKFYSTEV